MSKLCIWFFCLILAVVLTLPSAAQEITPRRWSHVPIDTNFMGTGYAYTKADISFDPVLLIEDAEQETDTLAVRYIRTFELFEKSARAEFAQAYQKKRVSGLLDGVPTTVRRSGMSDSFVRFGVNLIGAPPLKGEEFAAYRAKTDVETIVGTALVVQLPTGKYKEDRLINIGSNRFTFRPQLGVEHTRGKWTTDLTGSVWIYTDNDEFFNGNKREQDPLYTLQGHVIHTFRPGLWAGASGGYGYGGQSTVNGVKKDDRQEIVAWAFSAAYPITRRSGVKLAYIGTRTLERVGNDTDTIAVAFSILW